MKLYAFMDEKTEELGQRRRFITSCVGFIGEDWISRLDDFRAIGQLGRRRRFNGVQELLKACGAIAELTYADIPLELVPSGEIDGTSDVPRMARTDNTWGICFLYSLVPVMAKFHGARQTFESIEIYYDEKSLTIAHRQAIEKTFRSVFLELANAQIRKYGLNGGREIVITKVAEVQGSSSLRAADRFQLGTTIPHHICAQSERLIQDGDSSGIGVSNQTDRVKSTLNEFINKDITGHM